MLGLAPVVVPAADFSLPAIALLFLPLFSVHRGGREAIAKEHQALHDALTGLPNRELFRDPIDEAVRSSRRNGDPSVVMIMDLDHFKEINSWRRSRGACRPPCASATHVRGQASGRGHAIFEPELDRHSRRRLELAGGMRSAINDGQITLSYQPTAELHTGRISGVEALARWNHPEFGIVAPSEFVPIAEQTGLITPLTSFVLDAALRQVKQWNDAGLELS